MYNTKQLNALSIFEVAGKLGIIIKNKYTLCFIHNEKTPSLYFNTKNNTWKCFGCSEGGGVINLVMKKKEIDFLQACKWLDQNFLSGSTTLTPPYRRAKRIKNTPVTMDSIEEHPDCELYESIISFLDLSQKAIDYLTKIRAIENNVVIQNNLKSIDSISDFYNYIRIRFGDKRLIDAGLLKVDEDGNIKRTWWSDGIVFPYYSINGRIEMMQLRPYIPFPPTAKYILLKGIKCCLYNEIILRDLVAGSTLYICEGAPDTLSMLSKKHNAIGLPGVSSFKDEWIDMVGKYNIIILFDNDNAGIKNANILKNKFLSKGINVVVKRVTEYHDVNEMLVAESGKNQ